MCQYQSFLHNVSNSWFSHFKKCFSFNSAKNITSSAPNAASFVKILQYWKGMGQIQLGKKSWINRMREQGPLHRGHPALCLHQGFLQCSVSSAAQIRAIWVHSTKLTQYSEEITALCAPTGIFQAGLCLLFYSGRLSVSSCIEHLERISSETGNVGGEKVLQLLEKKVFKNEKSKI